MTFQPGELAKIALAIFFASYMVERGELLAKGTLRIGRFLVLDPKYIAPVLVAWGLSLMIFLFENDLGSSFLFFALFIGMLWVSTGRNALSGPGRGAVQALGAAFALKVIGHAKSRVHSWLNPWPMYNSPEAGTRSIQGWFAMAAGGVFGDGPGRGSPQRIPAAATDFIFAAIAEELGLLGAARHAGRLPAHGGHRSADRGALRPGLREAPGHGAVAHPRRPDLRDHRRRHPAHPPHRGHPAVHQLRRAAA